MQRFPISFSASKFSHHVWCVCNLSNPLAPAFLEHYLKKSAFLESLSNGLNSVDPVTDAMWIFLPVFQ